MSFALGIDILLDYTDWDRAQWHAWFREQGQAALAVGLGAHNDGRIKNIGELVRHIFSAELRYVERSLEKPLTDATTIPSDDVEALFAFGTKTRAALRDLLATFPDERWDVPQEVKLGPTPRQFTPRKMIVQALTHELRHWAQVATLLRLEGRKTGIHDFLLSPVLEPGGASSSTS